ncbi:hypothetical protein QS306_05220 [Paraburkholderia bonniea]|uniref:hypothetical protein n=1 Tax=Paraburkholderia bonniea TaxID=2152891 RepID=UPI0015807670|nr:hypothetical protein [Paraburkholderia bonniea]WJF91053.1 hypothetical protein QS306_05220 [Paraburkholderia bonniea]WJF94367.1 hypothetical protein QS308_05225 [Paraburkholderia bonniea]
MNGDDIAGLVGLGIGVLAFIALSVFEMKLYKREHNGEGMVHHWFATHHLSDWIHRKH